MDINEMTRKQFEELPLIDKFEPDDVDNIVLLPSRRHHDSGYNYYYVIPCVNVNEILRAFFKYNPYIGYYENDEFHRLFEIMVPIKSI